MQYNEFNRRLEKCHLDQDTKYLLAHLFETQIEINRQLDVCASLIAGLVQSTEQFVALHESTQGKVKQMMEHGRTPGVEVHSVRNDPDEGD